VGLDALSLHGVALNLVIEDILLLLAGGVVVFYIGRMFYRAYLGFQKRRSNPVEEAKERLTELYNAPVTTTTIEDDLLAAADLANVLGHPVYDCLYLAMAIRENTYVVTADGRFHAAVDRSPTLKGAVRMLGV